MFNCKKMNKAMIYRVLFYTAGLLILALGITLNTKAGLGVSPIISVSYSISTIWNFNFGNITLVLYGSFIVIEMLLHIIFRQQNRNPNLKLLLLLDLLQFPLSLIFTRFLNLFATYIPEFQTTYPDSFAGSLVGRVLFLLAAIILTGIGAALSLNMRLIPNPGDGIVQAISDCIGKTTGFTKNCFDLLCISFTICIGLFFAGHPIGVGLGTVLAVVGVGRVIAVFNHFCKAKTDKLAGL